jgi:O-antigen ligase
MTERIFERKRPFTGWLLVLVFALGLAGYPLVAPLPLILNVDSREISIPYRGFFLGLALMVIVAVIRRRDSFYFGRFWWVFWLFWGIYITRLFADTIVSPMPLRLPIEEYYLQVFGLVLFPTIAFFAVLKPEECRLAIFATLIVSVLACLANYYLAIDVLLSGSIYRLGTETLNPISFGYLGATVVLLASFALLRLSLQGLQGKIFMLCSIAIGLLAVGLAGSRGPLAALVITILVLLVYTLRQNTARRAAALTVFLVVFAWIALPYVVEMGSGIVERVEATGSGADPSDEDRIWLWTGAWSIFLDHPVVGSGIEPHSLGFYPHNVVLEGFMATGILGGSLLLLMLLYAAKIAIGLLQSRSEYGWIGLLYIQQLFAAITTGAIYGSTGLWYTMAAAVSADWALRLIRRQYSRARPSVQQTPGLALGVPR